MPDPGAVCIAIPSSLDCLHCLRPIDKKSIYQPFCCLGCKTVYQVLSEKGLLEYYEIREKSGTLRDKAPVQQRSEEYAYLDDVFFLKEYSYMNLHAGPTMEFYLEGIHCLACLWVLEKLPELTPNVSIARLNMGQSVLTVSLNDGGKFSQVARQLSDLGYRPHPLKIDQNDHELKTRENRLFIMRIGVAAAASGNIMIYAISLYAGASLEYERIFNLITVLFALPVLTFSAFPFYQNSINSLKNKTLSIDVPISVALIMGGVMGIYNLLVGIEENYFDSLTALVFLLLLSRYFLKFLQEKNLNTSDLHFFYQGGAVLKQNKSGEFVEIHPQFINQGDILKILPQKLVPADGVVLTGESYLNTSLLTGESQPEKVRVGNIIYSGTQNISSTITMQVNETDKKTRLGKILKQLDGHWEQKASISGLTQIVSKYFIAAVFIFSVILYLISFRAVGAHEALYRALTLLIVTCPCALAIATPLTFIRTLTQSLKKGIVIKNDLSVEKLAQSKTLFLDKTGTLTNPSVSVKSFKTFGIPKNGISPFSIIFSLEENCLHPVAHALKEFALTKNLLENNNLKLELSDLRETQGVGVSAVINEHYYEINKNGLFEDSVLLMEFDFEHSLYPDVLNILTRIKNAGLKIKILSGDKKQSVAKLAKELNLNQDEYQAELSPEEKGRIVSAEPYSIMAGDGANDALAFQKADVGIAVFGAMDISLRAADIYLSQPGLAGILDLITISRETMKVIYRNLFISLTYNSFSVYLAFIGKISPLTAAIIMPVSSLSVLFSTLIGTKTLRRIWKS